MMYAGEHAGLARVTVPAILRTIHTAEDRVEKVDAQTVARGLRFAESLVRRMAGTETDLWE